MSTEPDAAIPTPAATPPSDARVRAACERHWEQHKSDCSGFVRAVAIELAVTLTGNADAIVSQIQQAAWQSAVDGAVADGQARSGKLVVAGLAGPDHTPPREHGHVAVVVAGPLAHNLYPSAYWGQLGGVGRKNETLNWSWNHADRDKIIYGSIDIG